MSRTTRQIQSDGDAYRAVEAWRAATGHGLCYLVRLEGPDGPPVGDDRLDRRFALDPGQSLDGLEEGPLAAKLGEATPLTPTERRFRAPDDRLWLAQNVGPVWSEGGVAEGLTEILFTSLEGPPERAAAPGGHLGEMDEQSLLRRWEDAVRPEGGPDGGSASG